MTNLRPVQRRSVPDEVADQLTDVIVTGEVPPGDQLPSERDLAERLGVSRPTVRAALTRLAATGLVETRQGGGSTVQDFRRHAGLDLLPRLLLGRGGVDLRVVRDIVEARDSIGPQVAAMAARADVGPAADEELRAAADAVAAGETNPERQRAATAFWDVVVDRGGSIVFRLLYNQLRSAFDPALEALSDLLAAETDQPELFAAARRGDRRWRSRPGGGAGRTPALAGRDRPAGGSRRPRRHPHRHHSRDLRTRSNHGDVQHTTGRMAHQDARPHRGGSGPAGSRRGACPGRGGRRRGGGHRVTASHVVAG
jgi:GntR family transcriptional regulator, transcriptional repressor for pyruvate dehydrogenase complex